MIRGTVGLYAFQFHLVWVLDLGYPVLKNTNPDLYQIRSNSIALDVPKADPILPLWSPNTRFQSLYIIEALI